MTTATVSQLFVTMEQIERLIQAIDDLRTNVLSINPELFATLAEGPLDDLNRLQSEVYRTLEELQPLQSA